MKKIVKPTLARRKRERAISSQKAAVTGQRRFYNELRLKQKAANERMRQLEKAGIKSPAYQAIQGKLEILGKQKKGDRGRRFSETGKATYNEMEIQMKLLSEFLSQETSTTRGATDYYDRVWATANANDKITAAGISREQWFDFWENMPTKKKERLLASEQYVTMIQAYALKNGNLEVEDKMSLEDIADYISSKETVKDAYQSIGLTYQDMKKARRLGAL